MNELFKEMANRMATTYRVAQIYKDSYENKRECPFVSEFKGMEMALKTLGIDFVGKNGGVVFYCFVLVK